MNVIQLALIVPMILWLGVERVAGGERRGATSAPSSETSHRGGLSVAGHDLFLTYCGQIRCNGLPYDAKAVISLRFFNSPKGENRVGSEASLISPGFADGAFAARLHPGTPGLSVDCWLELSINGEVMTPRHQVVALDQVAWSHSPVSGVSDRSQADVRGDAEWVEDRPAYSVFGFLMPQIDPGDRHGLTSPALTATSSGVASWIPPTPGCACTNTGGDTCISAADVGSVRGDVGSDTIQVSGCGDGWFKVFVSENNIGAVDLVLTVDLVPASSDDYDLFVYEPCGTLVGSSTNGSGGPEHVVATVPDQWGVDDSRYFYINVTEVSRKACDQWTLTLVGN